MGCSNTLNYNLTVTETRTWSSTGINQISASTKNGNISVSNTQDIIITADISRSCLGYDKDEAEQHIDNVEVTDATAGGVLTLDADMPTNDKREYSASFDILAAEAIYLNLTSMNGQISLTGMTGGADVSTTNGNLSLLNTEGEMNLETTNGQVSVQNHTGSVDAETTNEKVDCDIALLGASKSVDLETTNGNVTLSLPADVTASFDASTTNGEVTVTGFVTVTYTLNETTHKVGKIGIGSGIAAINIRTTNGNVVIQVR